MQLSTVSNWNPRPVGLVRLTLYTAYTFASALLMQYLFSIIHIDFCVSFVGLLLSCAFHVPT